MGAYLIRRVVSALFALLGISVLAFATTALAPGSAASLLLGTFATPERVAAVTEELGLDKPVWARYFYWLREAVQGDLGVSTLSHQPVTSLLRGALPITLELALLAMALTVLVALPLGLWLGAHSEAWWARPAMFGVTLGISVPGFWTALILIIIFSVELRLLPTGGYVPFSEDPLGNLKSMVLPVVALSLWLVAGLTRFVRATTIGVFHHDYVRTARAKGISERKVLFGHVARNVAIPSITFIGLQLGTLVSGTIVTEVIFGLPGIGRLGLGAVLDRDYPVIQSVVLVVAGGYVVVNLLIDLTYGLIDPRARAA